MPTSSIVLELQNEALNPNSSVADILRKAKVVAAKLDQDDAIKWIDLELHGYKRCKLSDLPEYRLLTGELQAWNPYHGWVPVGFPAGKAQLKDNMSKAPIGQSIGALEAAYKNQENADILTFPLSPKLRDYFSEALSPPMDVSLHLGPDAPVQILDAVRNAILEWSLELEKAGILGEGLSFSMEDKKKAQSVTQNFFAQNIGHIGDLSDQAATTISQTSSGVQNIDQRKLDNFIGQAKQAVPLLPQDMQGEIEILLSQLEGEDAKPRIKKSLDSIKNILEGASGNVAAQGILQVLSSIL